MTEIPPNVLESPLDVLLYWFGSEYSDKDSEAISSVEYIQGRMPLWFARSSQAFDDMQMLNKHLIDKAISDPIWNENCPTTCLAKVILFDQFPRSIYRGTAKAFCYEKHTNAAIEVMFQSNWLTDSSIVYSSSEIFFIVVALQHSEDLATQTCGYNLAKSLLLRSSEGPEVNDVHDASMSAISSKAKEPESGANIPVGMKQQMVEYLTSLKGFPGEHYDVIVKFGRFPSRNDILVSRMNDVCRSGIAI